jgi:RHS repeat-associated protein
VARQDFGYSNGCGTTNPNVGLDCTGPGGFSESSYAYDAVGNLRMHFLNWLQGVQTDSTTYATGNRIQTAWGPGLTYEHDLDGNIRRKYGASTDIRYAWSADGRLTGDTVAATGVTIGYDYNAFGLLVRRTRNGTPDRYYLWEGVEPLAELDGTASNRIAEYAYLPGRVDQPFALITGATTIASPAGIRDVELDALGNVIGVLGSGSISVAQRRLFDLWGVKTSETGTLGDTAWLGWKALLWEGDSTQLYYARNRWYDPGTGRFVSEDPIGLAGGINRYTFGGGDPVNRRDPLGLHFGPTIFGCLDRGCNHGARPRLTGKHIVACEDRGDCDQSRRGELFAEQSTQSDYRKSCSWSALKSNAVDGAIAGAVVGALYGAGVGAVVGYTGGEVVGGWAGALIGAPLGPGAVVTAVAGGYAGGVAGAIAIGWVGAHAGAVFGALEAATSAAVGTLALCAVDR